MLKWAAITSLLAAAILLYSGCGSSSPDCDRLIDLSVSPPAGATADHAAAAPANQIQFYAGADAPQGCFVGGCLNCSGQTWTVSDAVNVSISNNQSDNGLATCLGATNGPISITATAPAKHGSTQTISGTATLMCR